MSLPVACVETCVLDRVTTVDHHSVADVDTDVGRADRIVGALEKHQIAGLNIGRRYSGADVSQAFGTKPPKVPAYAAVVADIGNET